MRQIPSIGRILQTDYWAMLSGLAPLIGWVMYAVALYANLRFEPGRFIWIAVALTVIGIPALVWRISLIRSVFERGVAVDGVITDVGFYRDRGRVEFQYTYEERVLHGGNALHRNARTRRLIAGQAVMVVVDTEKPERAFLLQPYIDA